MTKHQPENGFAHNPDPIDGVEARIKRNVAGDVTISFGDGSEPMNVSRREFMRIGGVAAATAAMTGTGCNAMRNDVEYIVPYVDRPEEVRIGTPNYYTTVCSGCNTGCGALVTSRGGRPIKLDGNPHHPLSQGALCSRGLASYMNLYDPDRAKSPLKVARGGGHTPVKWEEVDRAVISAVEKAKSGGGIGILTQNFHGSARKALLAAIQKGLPGLKHYQYDAINSEALRAANQATYSDAHIPSYDFSKADYVVSLGSDFLGSWLSPVLFTKQFSSRRNPDGNMNKMVAFEGTMTLTGMNADERFRVRPGDLVHIAMALLHTVLVTRKTGALANSPIAAAVQAFSPAEVASKLGIDADALTRVGQELADNAGKSLIVAGGTASATAQGVSLEVAVNALNAALGNVGNTIDHVNVSNQQSGTLQDLKNLITDINAGKIDVLIIDRANPIYSAPRALGFEEAISKVKLVISTTDRVDETSLFATYLAPAGHQLEQWGDSNPVGNVYAIQQPVILPLHDTRGFEHSLMLWFGGALPGVFDVYLAAPQAPAGTRAPGVPTDPGPWYRFIRQHWETTLFPRARSMASFDQFWMETLQKGVFELQAQERRQPRFDATQAVALLPKALPEATSNEPGDLSKKEIQLVATPTLFDGEHANNGHLQETPEVVTKHVWGSYAMVSPATFKAAKLKSGQILSIALENVVREFQVIMQPGMHDDVIGIPLGYGRTAAGVVGNDVGENGFLFGHESEGRHILAGLKLEVKDSKRTEKLSVIKGAGVIDLHRRNYFASTTLEEYKEDKSAGVHKHPDLNDMWDRHKYEVKWGMAIDLSKCTGCSACVTACQEENNIPVVGRTGILEGREMHWMRIDRYYEMPHEAAHKQSNPINFAALAHQQYSDSGDPMLHPEPLVALAEYMDEPRVLFQPMMCQHCENAPCENVCPVSATMHSEDGLNQMIYNRCVGTRYCSNNCPFKVRRYNWFNYAVDRSDTVFARLYPELGEHKRLNIEEPLPMAMNPEVTVRERGIMEKCTFCVHRIRRANWTLRQEGRTKFRDGDVVTACQQACPADAIVFGDLMDETSAVAKLHAVERKITPLDEVGVRSSVAYLTNVWNAPKPAHDADHGATDQKETH